MAGHVLAIDGTPHPVGILLWLARPADLFRRDQRQPREELENENKPLEIKGIYPCNVFHELAACVSLLSKDTAFRWPTTIFELFLNFTGAVLYMTGVAFKVCGRCISVERGRRRNRIFGLVLHANRCTRLRPLTQYKHEHV